MTQPCPFCAIGAGDVDENLVAFRSERVFVVPTVKQIPANPGRVIVCPVTHATTLHSIEPALLHDVFDVTARVAGAAPAAFQALGTLILINNDAPDQKLHHLHVHVTPRFAGDQLVMPSPDVAPAPLAQQLEIAARLRRALQTL